MSMSAQEWFRSPRYRRLVSEHELDERNQQRMARTRTRRRDWSGFGGSVDQAIARETGGCFISESGNRGDAGVMASYEYIPEVAEEDARVVENDRLRRFLHEDEIPATMHGIEFVEDEDGDFDIASVDRSVGPKFIRLNGSVDKALAELLGKSPKYAIQAYRMATDRRRPDILVRVVRVVAVLVQDGAYTLGMFQQTPNDNGFSCYQVLKGYAASERTPERPEGGFAARILHTLRSGQEPD